MLFNSASFAIFFPVVYFLYWSLQKKQVGYQNTLLLFASYFFYACWDYRFLFLLVFSTVLDYVSGIQIATARKERNKWIWFCVSVGVNLGFLGFFKYYDFFAQSFANLLSGVGLKVNVWSLRIVLPVGISFYTFHGLSYVIDVYKGKIKPEKNFVDYSLFVSFFPLLVAGPIERATHLLPQLKKKREFNYAASVDGLRQILWGLFKKIVIADNCAEYANGVFNHYGAFSGSTLVLGAIFFAFQIYCDFSGYSDIALGTARLLGIDLLRNFAYPYFSRDIAEFWRRWHISLSSWFKDYLYIPLGGSKGGTWMKIRNTFIIFIVSGFWHGANWTFVVWGALNALYFLPLLLTERNRHNLQIVASDRLLPTLNEFGRIIGTFALTVFAWIFFRSETVSDALGFISSIFSRTLIAKPQGGAFIGANHPIAIGAILILFLIIEWMGRADQYAIASFGIKWPRTLRWGFYFTIVFCVFYLTGAKQQFIYFQF